MSNDRDKITEWLREEFEVVEERGEVSAVVLVHIAHSGETQMHQFLPQNANWKKPEEMARVFDSVATRHAKGIVGGGQQQYQLMMTRGTDATTTSVLPLIRFGASNLMGPQGSLSTEAPTPMGMAQQTMRHQELMIQGSFEKDRIVFHEMRVQLQELRADNRLLRQENLEVWMGAKDLALELIKRREDERQREINARRMAEFQKQAMKLAPALINMMAGKEVFPLSRADSDMIDAIAELASPDEIHMLTAGLQQKEGGQQLAALLVSRFDDFRKRKSAEEAAEARLLKELPKRSYEEAERDAAGEAMQMLAGKTPGLKSLRQLVEGTRLNGGESNGANGHTAEAKAEPVASEAPAEGVMEPASEPAAEAAADDDRALLDDFFGTVPAAQFHMLASVLGEGHPQLAERLKRRHAAALEKKK